VETAHLEMTGVRHEYGPVTVLDIPRFSIFRGECLAVLGPNGSGKSTLLRLASLQERPTQGTISYRGEEVVRRNGLDVRRRFVLLLQRPFLFAGSVERNVAYGLKVRKVARPEVKRRLEKAAALFSIGHLLGRDARKLSGGEVQRVNLARAFALEPDILFLDEPFSPLDAPSREEIIAELGRVLRATGQTAVFVTHHREEAAYLGDRLAVLVGGRLLQEGRTEDVFAAPADDEAARLLGHATLLKGVVEEQRGDLLVVSHGGHRIMASGRADARSEVLLFVRPEDVLLARQRFESSVRNWFEGRVVEVAPSDRFALITMDCGFPLKALLTKASVEELGIRPGETVWAGVKASSLRALPAAADNENGNGEG
jgi:molybdopterin-binding protein